MGQEVKIVLGFAFGDEGKGNTVQYLCKQALACHQSVAVVRFCGGAQAGHRVIFGETEHVCSSFGSGSLLGVPTIYLHTDNVLVDPIAMYNEHLALEAKGYYNLKYPKFDDTQVLITTPYDIDANLADSKTMLDGSCGKGINATVERYRNTYPKNLKCLESLSMAEDYYESFNKEYHESFKVAFNDIWSSGCISHDANDDELDDYDVLIFEGTQGLLLDSEFGFAPHNTATKVGLNGIPKKYLTEDTEVYLVTRSYLTRHGNGYVPIVPTTSWMDIPPEPTNFDTGYQGVFKIGAFEPELLNRAIDRHHLDNYNVNYRLVVTHCDLLVNAMLPYEYMGKMDSIYLTEVGNMINLPWDEVWYFDSPEM